MHRFDDPSASIRHIHPLGDERWVAYTAGIAGVLAGAVFLWHGHAEIISGAVNLWEHAIRLGFHALFISGLGLCS